MYKFATALLIAIVLAVTVLPVVFAQTMPEPTGSCPPGFERHHMGEHMDMDHSDHHIGTHADQNGDGYVCVKHLKNNLHVHVDNMLPLE